MKVSLSPCSLVVVHPVLQQTILRGQVSQDDEASPVSEACSIDGDIVSLVSPPQALLTL